MKTYLFHTTATMKEYNNKKWWIDRNIIRDMEISAENVRSALEIFRQRVADESYIEISVNALKSKSPMYCDYKDGSTRQVGYVITGKAEFEGWNNCKYSKQYIDLWVSIKEVAFCEFEESA